MLSASSKQRSSRRRAVLVAWLAIGTSAATGTATAQRLISIPTKPMCQTCTITLDSIAVLGANEDSVTLSRSSNVVRGSNGRFYVGPLYDAGKIAVYDDNGKFIHTAGRQGRGPGEVPTVDFLSIGPGDTIAVFAPGKVVIFTEQLRTTQDVTLNALARGGILVGSTTIIIHAYTGHPSTPRHPLHVFSLNGQLQRSFGADAESTTTADLAAGYRWLAQGQQGSLWVARPNQYQFELWDTAGVLLTRLTGAPPWFEAWDSYPQGAPYDSKPPPQVVALARGTVQNHLWILSYVPDESWSPHRQAGRERPVIPALQHDLFDSVLDVIDVASGELLASRRLDIGVDGFAGPGLLYVRDETPSGLIVVRLYRLALQHEGGTYVFTTRSEPRSHSQHSHSHRPAPSPGLHRGAGLSAAVRSEIRERSKPTSSRSGKP